MSKTMTMCRDWKRMLYCKAIAGVAVGAVTEVLFPKAVNRIVFTAEAAVPFSYTVAELGITGSAVDPPTIAQALSGVLGAGIFTCPTDFRTVLEFTPSVASFKFRNLGTNPSNPTIEGHIVGAEA
jgi:hypothetical protein